MTKKKINFSNFDTESKNLLVTAESTVAEVKKESKTPQRVGRPPKNVKLKQSEAVTVKFTVDEMDTITRKAGDVPLATYLRKLLIEKTDLLN